MIYLAYLLPKEKEDLLSQVREPFDDHLDLVLDDHGDHVDALKELENPAQGRGGGGASYLIG